MMGDWHLRPIVITAYPSETLPQTLSILLQHPGYLTLSIRFRCLSPYDAQKKLEKEKPFWRQTAIGDFIEIIKSVLRREERRTTSTPSSRSRRSKKPSTPPRTARASARSRCVAIVRDRDPREADHRAHNLPGILQGKGIMCRIETSAPPRRSGPPGRATC